MQDNPAAHYIEEDLTVNAAGEPVWVEQYAAQGVREFEVLLAKHAAFLDYLEEHDA